MQRVASLVAAFEHIARTRMAGVPLLHAALRTEAVGFQPQADDDGEAGLLGVLVTPWFMNLLWLPGAQAAPLALGATRPRRLGGETLSFLGGEEGGCRFEACSLFSPMFEFADQHAARAVALAALGHLRQPQAAAAVTAAPVVKAAPAPASAAPGVPTRRGLLFGRRAAKAAR
ncbi:[NiFe]-hydrogenase assembly chaperone HybE [uncultured Azohydromonas sp.]|uniref:[NiFe]-hydrogenase assembly chaperone HybE n=1 Tax=uncultured Azohydromonas sp. TaxID=487342 RepID=UPI00260657CD|nr:[NiFe]-hydrogenase assembly chaperone HybE [uncultured Azohydromonas sp.]